MEQQLIPKPQSMPLASRLMIPDQWQQADEGCCHKCGEALWKKDSERATLLGCIKESCENHWEKDGAELIMSLK